MGHKEMKDVQFGEEAEDCSQDVCWKEAVSLKSLTIRESLLLCTGKTEKLPSGPNPPVCFQLMMRTQGIPCS